MSTLPTDIQRRLGRVARVIDRCQRWQKLALLKLDEEDADDLAEEGPEIDWLDSEEISQDDGSAPVGPRKEKNTSRYQLQPGHAQNLSDLLRAGQKDTSSSGS